MTIRPALLMLSLLLAACADGPAPGAVDGPDPADPEMAAHVARVERLRGVLGNEAREHFARVAGPVLSFYGELMWDYEDAPPGAKVSLPALDERAQAVLARFEGDPLAGLAEWLVSEIVLRHVLDDPAAGRHPAMLLRYARGLVDTASPAFPTLLATLERLDGHPAEVRLLARKALINLDLMARWAAEERALAVRSGFPVDDDGWPPIVRDVDGGYHPLDVEQTRARLRALAGE